MPNFLSFDVFFDKDILNFTASRATGAPKVKPGWKVRTAPKLPPKETPKIEGEEELPKHERKNIPKLAAKGSPAPKLTPKATTAPKLPTKAVPKAPPKKPLPKLEKKI